MDTSQAPQWIADALAERARQDEKWDTQQRHLDGTGDIFDAKYADVMRRTCDLMEMDGGTATWRVILLEEVYEALAESDVDELRKELVQVIAVCGAWIEDIDTRERNEDDTEGAESAAT